MQKQEKQQLKHKKHGLKQQKHKNTKTQKHSQKYYF